jgi:hypothetical protein
MKTYTRRSILSIFTALLALGFGAGVAQAAIPSVSGTFTTPKVPAGTIRFTAVKAVRVGSSGVAYIGNVNISGRTYPGNLYGANMTWFYPVNYATMGDTNLTLQPDGSFAGTITFYNKRGAVIDQGTAQTIVK